jgi:hypothetical protein
VEYIKRRRELSPLMIKEKFPLPKPNARTHEQVIQLLPPTVLNPEST